jgi:hypothetical protein
MRHWVLATVSAPGVALAATTTEPVADYMLQAAEVQALRNAVANHTSTEHL